MSYEAVEDGELAAVVTYLEMSAPTEQAIPSGPLSLNRVEVPQPEHYRELFCLIGAPWLCTRKSGIIHGAAEDAERLADRIAARR